MTRYFIYIKFDGTNYHGWQIQLNSKTVQEELQNAMSLLLQKRIEVVGAGRTDAGVHAKQMIAHFDVDEKIVIDDFKFRLNNMLSASISIDDLIEVLPESHARFDATSRSYEYHIHQKKDVFLHKTSYLFSQNLDIQLMNQAAEKLIGKADFSCFSKSNTQTLTNVCEITKAKWIENENQLVFEITANRFLRNMVRAIVGTLIEVGEGKRDVDSLMDLLESKNRSLAGSSAPACGLFLTSIEYPADRFV